MAKERSIESLIMTLDLCEHHLPKSLPSIHRQNLRRIKHMLRELAGTVPQETDQSNGKMRAERDDNNDS